MRRRTSKTKRRLLRKFFRSCSSLLKISLKTLSVAVIWLIKYVLVEVIFWFVIPVGLGSMLVAFGMPQNIALKLATAIVLGLLTLAACILYKLERERQPTRHQREGETKLASRISRTFASQTSTEWHEYQDWLHDILLARRQLLAEKCPRWKVKLITYQRLAVFCIVVAIAKVKQTALRIGRSR